MSCQTYFLLVNTFGLTAGLKHVGETRLSGMLVDHFRVRSSDVGECPIISTHLPENDGNVVKS